jgi:hypothetical protein
MYVLLSIPINHVNISHLCQLIIIAKVRVTSRLRAITVRKILRVHIRIITSYKFTRPGGPTNLTLQHVDNMQTRAKITGKGCSGFRPGVHT